MQPCESYMHFKKPYASLYVVKNYNSSIKIKWHIEKANESHKEIDGITSLDVIAHHGNREVGGKKKPSQDLEVKNSVLSFRIFFIKDVITFS